MKLRFAAIAAAIIALPPAAATADSPTVNCFNSGLQGIAPAAPSSLETINMLVAWQPICGHFSCVRYPTHWAGIASVDGSVVRLDFYAGLAPVGVPGAVWTEMPPAFQSTAIIAARIALLPPGTYTLVAQVHAVDDAGGAPISCPSAMFTFRVSGPRAQVPAKATVVEYYHTPMDHYFATADAMEIAALDAGVFAGWSRTGRTWSVWAPGRSGGQGVPVCRFYTTPQAGFSSHFITASLGECDLVPVLFPSVWRLESANVWEAPFPMLVTSQCPLGSGQIWRFWNGRSDTNHRYVTTYADRVEMLARGWKPEGWGSGSVAMCTAP
jgi:hypothetical protein